MGGADGGHGGWEAKYNPYGRTVEDLFMGEWTDDYLAGAAGPMHAAHLRYAFGPRRSLDSGILEASPAGGADEEQEQ